MILEEWVARNGRSAVNKRVYEEEATDRQV